MDKIIGYFRTWLSFFFSSCLHIRNQFHLGFYVCCGICVSIIPWVTQKRHSLSEHGLMRSYMSWGWPALDMADSSGWPGEFARWLPGQQMQQGALESISTPLNFMWYILRGPFKEALSGQRIWPDGFAFSLGHPGRVCSHGLWSLKLLSSYS